MKLKYCRVIPKFEDREPSESFLEDLKLIDTRLDVAFNRVSGKWEIYRKDNKGQWQWIYCVEDENEQYRPLDNRTLKKLQEMDIIRRFGSVQKYEEHLNEKQKKWKESEQRKIDHELKWDLKDDKVLWQSAAENFCAGRIN